MPAQMHILSKSTFVRGCQCVKSLYLNKYYKEFQSPLSLSQKAIFDQGNDVGILARELYPNGIDVSPKELHNYEYSIEKTQCAISSDEVIIYEAAFLFNGVYSAIDILVRDDDGWKAFEVKSSTDIKDTYILDAALQYYVIKNSGINLKDVFIIYINNKYIRSYELDLERLLIKKSILKEVINLQTFIPNKITEFKSILQKNEIPNIEIGLQCNNPYPCDFIDYCWKKVPQYSIFDISNLRVAKKFELFNQGILELKDIPKSFKLNQNQWQQINCELEKKSIVHKPKIKEFLENLLFPIYFLDFETFQLAIPKFINSRPYQQLVFQYSLHQQNSSKSELLHSEFIADINSNDPRVSFIKRLIEDCGRDGDILVYNIAFEKTRLQELAIDFPEFSDSISNIINRLKDLMIPFRERWIYTPNMKGSYSIKVVVSALIPEFTYENLEIKDGVTASSTYSLMVSGAFSGNVDRGLKALLEYCKFDTLAMVKILEKLILISSI